MSSSCEITEEKSDSIDMHGHDMTCAGRVHRGDSRASADRRVSNQAGPTIDAIVLAVPIVLHDPAERDMADSAAMNSSEVMSPAYTHTCIYMLSIYQYTQTHTHRDTHTHRGDTHTETHGQTHTHTETHNTD